MTQALYAHMNNKRKKKEKQISSGEDGNFSSEDSTLFNNQVHILKTVSISNDTHHFSSSLQMNSRMTQMFVLSTHVASSFTIVVSLDNFSE
jgi:hypothetical protein